MFVLGIESSCDDTAAAIVADGREIISNVVSSQISDHQKYGGVVPEIASRKHLENILPVISESLKEARLELSQIDLIAVTCGPGLIGSLLVGTGVAKAISYASGIPLVGVNHLEGHLTALQLGKTFPSFPFLGLVVSGGHSNLYLVSGHGQYRRLGQTRDDAAGEAFDKVAKVMGLGYPGGPVIDKLASQGNPMAIDFPRSYLEKDSLDFSFSGIKTAVWYYIKKKLKESSKLPDSLIADIAASFQAAVVEVLVTKTIQAAKANGVKQIAISGGVACNSELRKQMREAAGTDRLELFYPAPKLCTDNAAMVAAAGYFRYKNGKRADYTQIDAITNFSHAY